MSLKLKCNSKFFNPVQALNGVTGREVFEANPAVVTKFLEDLENVFKVDFTRRIWFMSVRNLSYLNMS